MKIWLTRLGFLAALGFVALTVVNASWLAKAPGGSVKLVAQRGVAQVAHDTRLGPDNCTAAAIEPPLHDFIDNTGPSAKHAGILGMRLIEIDLAMTKDGDLAVFGDTSLDCRTDGSGPVGSKTMEELGALDAGYGYTADSGKTFPLRGKGVGAIRPLERFLQSVSSTNRLVFNFGSDDHTEADLLATKLKLVGRDPEKRTDVFFGDAAPVARIKEIYPEAWAFSPEAAKQCASDYVLTGWTSFLPESCKGGTMIIPVDEQWKFWGWPNKLIARMAEFGGTIIVSGPESAGEPIAGLTLPEQLGDIPRDFNGYIWVDDTWAIAPALYPSSDRRSKDEIAATNAALEKRRERQ
ncbi:glycerophosphodiester phosphodiesterase family protein [Pontixanthobacter gangjinensis]|uniref:GP-PDE domain-containing protein n=1 Tax=Pontixanthobacter gangjinensis TaxID=1028742 RepID=A0A6I4SJ41_9SPHN|nr:glycerophosphodiester phosphodiesterase family protein [Pontixanthobacter gangjinensis]MXO55604.1 hypothetical protein [Pontixanthobacter gangjinensis]